MKTVKHIFSKKRVLSSSTKRFGKEGDAKNGAEDSELITSAVTKLYSPEDLLLNSEDGSL